MAEMTVPLVSRGNGLWGSPSPAWDHLINRESSGRPTVIQSPSVVDVNTGGNEAEGLFQITPKTWQRHNGTDFAPTARRATPQQQAIVAARIFTRNPTGSDWGAGRPGRESASNLAAGLVPLDSNQPVQEYPMAVSGDPVWLEDVLREALGDRLVVHDGWKDRGAGGTMGTIWGTMIHHTGNVNERVEVIRDGVQQPTGWLPGPLSQCLITPDGICHLVAVGPCNHAGSGNWGTLTQGNRDCIGFECAYSGSGAWPQKQIITMRDATAAISKKIGKRADDSVCGHKEYAKPQGRKVDPGNMDMNWFRAEVQKDLDGFVFPGEGVASIPPTPVPPTQPTTPTLSDRQLLLEVWEQLRGPGGKGWPQLGGKSLVDGLAELLKDKL